MTLRWLARTVAAFAVALFAATAVGVGAASAFQGDYYFYRDDGDRGGSSGHVWLEDSRCDICYSVQFWAKGERLHLWDFLSDGRRAEAVVVVYDRSGTIVDVDRFFTGTNEEYNLGTPDGSGNIPEGYQVTMRVRAEWGAWSPTLRLTA